MFRNIVFNFESRLGALAFCFRTRDLRMLSLRLTQSILILLLSISFVKLPEISAAEPDPDKALLQSTVRICYERRENEIMVSGHGTAFGVDLSQFGFVGKRYLLSACHNVLDERDRVHAILKIEINDGERKHWARCNVAAYDKNLDICLLESSEDLPQILQLGNAEALPGSQIILAGSPRGIPVSIFSGSVINCFDHGTVKTSARIAFDHGDSGAPVICPATHKVAGVAVAGVPKDGDLDHEIGLFVPLAGIASFLQSNQRGVSTYTPPVAMAIVNANDVERVEPRPLGPVFSISADEDETLVLQTSRSFNMATVRTIPAVDVRASSRQSEPWIPSVLANSRIHVIASGDTLSGIAKTYGLTLRQLVQANSITDPNYIKVGAKLIIPGLQ